MHDINPTFTGLAGPDMCDVMGHMNARHYLAMFDDASCALLAHISAAPLAAEDLFGWADVRCEIDYLREIAAGASLAIFSTVEKIGRTSLTLRHELRGSQDDALHAASRIISVRFDKQHRIAMPIEPDLRRRARILLETGLLGGER